MHDFQGGRVLGHFGFWDEDPDGVFPVCWVRGASAKDLRLSVQLYPVRPPDGIKDAVHDGAGLVVRLQDADNYYLIRVVPHEKRVRFYRIEDGKRTTLGGKDVDIEVEQWHVLTLHVSMNTFTLFLNGENLLHILDETFKEPGSYGLWSKPNNITYFRDLNVEILQ